jgi:nicotinate-nucleotide pyrophosphorylase (carboxylating)
MNTVMTFTAAETAACRRLIEWAVEEDLGLVGDVTSQALIPADLVGEAAFVARARGTLAGLPAAALVLAAVDPRLALEADVEDGAPLNPGDRLGTVRGPMGGVLAAERLALNFLQRLSGVATLTRTFVEAVGGLPCQVLDTRKTTPGWRLLEKYAVRCGGGHNHRLGLYDGLLIKDNHLAALGTAGAPIQKAVRAARARAGHALPLEIEVDTLDQLDQALTCQPDMVLLDNMPPGQLREAVRRRDARAPKVLLEASGGVTLATVRALAETGVDRISIGALTHSAPSLDVGLDYVGQS